mgnify:CR=1 FL=1
MNDKIKLDNVEFLANKKNNNIYSDPTTMLLDAVKNNEGAGYNKAVLLLLDDRDGRYRLHYMASQMKCSEIIAACDIMQARMRNGMGH